MSRMINKHYVLRVAEIIYLEVFNLKKKNNLNNVEAFELFIGSDTYKKIRGSSLKKLEPYSGEILILILIMRLI